MDQRKNLWEPTIGDVLEAHARIAPHLPPTPLVQPLALKAEFGCEIFLKCENMQPVGAFKVRGGVNLAIVERDAGVLPEAGLAAASTGNHGQSVAYAARLVGVPAVIFAPVGANPLKVRSMERLGAQVILTGADFDEAREASGRFAEERGMRYVHSANEPLLVAGVATAYLEAMLAVPDADVMIVPIGAGSGASGAGIVGRALRPQMRIIGVQAEGAPAVYRSFYSGRPESTETAATRAEGLATRVAFDYPLGLLRRNLDEIVLVSDDEMLAAVKLLVETAHVVAEEAGAASVAAAWQLKDQLKGKKVIAPITGGNATAAQLAEALRERQS